MKYKKEPISMCHIIIYNYYSPKCMIVPQIYLCKENKTSNSVLRCYEMLLSETGRINVLMFMYASGNCSSCYFIRL